MTTAVALKYWEITKVYYTNSTTYVVNILAKSATVVLRIWIYTQLYRVTYAFAGVTEIGGMTIPMIIWILMFTQGFRSATRPGVMRLINEEVKSGEIAYTLNRPYSYILFHYFGYLGRIIPTAVTNLLVGIPAAYVLVGPVSLSPFAILFGLVLLFLGYTLEFLISLILGLTSFWVEDNSAFEWLYQKGQMVFGGNVLPLALFPLWLKSIAEFMPFSQLFYGPSQMMVSFDPATYVRFLSFQLFWILVFGLTAKFLFWKGGKNVAINGG